MKSEKINVEKLSKTFGKGSKSGKKLMTSGVTLTKLSELSR